METTTGNRRRSNLRNGTLGSEKASPKQPSALPLPPSSGGDVDTNSQRGEVGGTSSEKSRRRAPAKTDRDNPATRQLIEWVDTVGVKRASEVLGEAPSTIKRWGVTHTPNADHIAAFQSANATPPKHIAVSLPRAPVDTGLDDLESDEDVEYIDNRPIEDAATLPPKDPKQLEEVAAFSHARISKPSGIQAKLIGRNGEVKVAPINATPRPARVIQPQPPAPIQNPEVGGRKIMTEAEYKELMRRTHDPVNSVMPPQAAVAPQRATTYPRQPLPPPQVPQNKFREEPEYEPVRSVPRNGKVSDQSLEVTLQHYEQNPDQITEEALAVMRRIFFPWQGRQVYLAFPVIKATNPGTAWAIAQLMRDLGDKCADDIVMGNSNIDHARNILAHKFLRSKSEYMLFIDDDVVPPTGRPKFFKYVTNPPPDYPDDLAGVHVVEQLLSRGKTLVGGLYFGRQAGGAPVFHEGLTNPQFNEMARDLSCRDLLATEWFATGCMMIHRSVFESMKQAFPKLRVNHEDFEYDFFQKIPGSGEDASFCRRAKQAGHQPYIDLSVRCAHVGYCAWSSYNTQSVFR